VFRNSRGISTTPIMEEIYLYNARNPQTVIDFIKGYQNNRFGISKAENAGYITRQITENLLQ